MVMVKVVWTTHIYSQKVDCWIDAGNFVPFLSSDYDPFQQRQVILFFIYEEGRPI